MLIALSSATSLGSGGQTGSVLDPVSVSAHPEAAASSGLQSFVHGVKDSVQKQTDVSMESSIE